MIKPMSMRFNVSINNSKYPIFCTDTKNSAYDEEHEFKIRFIGNPENGENVISHANNTNDNDNTTSVFVHSAFSNFILTSAIGKADAADISDLTILPSNCEIVEAPLDFITGSGKFNLEAYNDETRTTIKLFGGIFIVDTGKSSFSDLVSVLDDDNPLAFVTSVDKKRYFVHKNFKEMMIDDLQYVLYLNSESLGAYHSLIAETKDDDPSLVITNFKMDYNW